MNGCVVNLSEKGTKTYLIVHFNIPLYSGKMAIPDMILMDSGFIRETLANILLLDQVWNEIMVQSIPMAKVE